MARRLRLQYPGATYHVINRGNYRCDLFESAGAAQAFERALGEACRSFGWVVHAFVIMRNHFHVAMTTRDPNLVEGMHWLQSTFAVRFNRFRAENGHVFQGRYRAIPIEDDHALARVVDYIHLNPVRAKIVPPEEIGTFRHSSLPRFLATLRPDWLVANRWLGESALEDSPDSWRRYLARLAATGAETTDREAAPAPEFSQDWAIGTDAWRKALAREHAHLALEVDVIAAEVRELKEARWTAALEGALGEANRTAADLVASAKGVRWKVEIARRLRRQAGAPYAWIADALRMGSAGAVRVAVCRLAHANRDAVPQAAEAEVRTAANV
jgi:putative transposase